MQPHSNPTQRMTPLIAIVILFLLTFSLAATERPPIVGIAHIAFQVSDLAKAKQFYGDLLGYEDGFRLFKEDGSTLLVYFKVNDRQYIEIIPGLPPDQSERLSHIAFETPNLEILRSYLAEKGVKVPDKANQGRDGNLNMMVTDPDGHHVEFVQYLPDSLHMKARGSYLPSSRISDRMLHVGVTVADVTKADHFYKEILGFSEIWRGGFTDKTTQWINMKLPDSTDYLEYMLVTGNVDRKQLGILHHLALQVSDMQKSLEAVRIRPQGGNPTVVGQPLVGRNNRWQLNLIDPDGSRTELMEPFTMR